VNELAHLLDALGREPDERMSVCHLNGNFHATIVPVSAAQQAADAHTGLDVWFGTQALHPRVTTGRGTAKDVIGIRALSCDLDVKPGGMPTMQAAGDVINTLSEMLGARPVAIVMSGHGLQPHWAVERDNNTDWPDETDHRHAAAMALWRRFGRLVKNVAQRHGGDADSVFDLARVMRCPGTLNCKDKTNPVRVLTVPSTGSPIALETIADTCTQYGIPEHDEDSEILGDVKAPAGDWTWATQTCQYVTRMISGWQNDNPPVRHPWLVAQATRLAVAHRLGCITQADHNIGMRIIADTFRRALTAAPARSETPSEVTDAFRWGIERAQVFSDDRARNELGSNGKPHTHGIAELTAFNPDLHSGTGTVTYPPAAGTDTTNILELRRAQLAQHYYEDLLARADAKKRYESEILARDFKPPVITTLREELLIPDAPVAYRVDKIMPTGANVLLTAKYKTGKTTTMGNLAKALVDGGSFLGKFPTAQLTAGRGVAIFNYELSRDQFRTWLREIGVINQDAIHMFNLRGIRLPLTQRWAQDKVIDWLGTRNISAWIVDPYARAMNGSGDENSNTDAGEFVAILDAIKEEACVDELVMPIHTGRATESGDRARGATRLNDWADVQWLLTRDADKNRFFSAEGRDVDVEEEMVTFDETTRELKMGGGDRNWVARRALAEKVISIVKENPGIKAGDLVSACKAKRENVLQARDEALYSHQIRTVEEGTSVLHYPSGLQPWIVKEGPENT
jgi:hypothetical protein